METDGGTTDFFRPTIDEDGRKQEPWFALAGGEYDIIEVGVERWCQIASVYKAVMEGHPGQVIRVIDNGPDDLVTVDVEAKKFNEMCNVYNSAMRRRERKMLENGEGAMPAYGFISTCDTPMADRWDRYEDELCAELMKRKEKDTENSQTYAPDMRRCAAGETSRRLGKQEDQDVEMKEEEP